MRLMFPDAALFVPQRRIGPDFYFEFLTTSVVEEEYVGVFDLAVSACRNLLIALEDELTHRCFEGPFGNFPEWGTLVGCELQCLGRVLLVDVGVAGPSATG